MIEEVEIDEAALAPPKPPGARRTWLWVLLAGSVATAVYLATRTPTEPPADAEEAPEDALPSPAQLPPAPPSLPPELAESYSLVSYGFDTRGHEVVARELDAAGFEQLSDELRAFAEDIEELESDEYADFVLAQLERVHGQQMRDLGPVTATRAGETLIVYPDSEEFEVRR